MEINFELRDGESYVTLVGDRGLKGAYGLHGGADGAPAEHVFRVAGSDLRPEHVTKIDRLLMTAGDQVRLRTLGGGGYGDSARRDLHARVADERDGCVAARPTGS